MDIISPSLGLVVGSIPARSTKNAKICSSLSSRFFIYIKKPQAMPVVKKSFSVVIDKRKSHLLN